MKRASSRSPVLVALILGHCAFAAGASSQIPSISGLSPTQGSAGTSLAISGNNFGATQGTSTVSFGGVVASVTSWSATSIVAIVPSDTALGLVNVRVTVAGNVAESKFTVLATLRITSPANGTIFAPGQSFQVSVTSPTPNAFSAVAVVPQDPFDLSTVQNALPTTFSYTVPSKAACRPYSFIAMGTMTSGPSVQSAPIFVDVERPDFPTSLSTLMASIRFSAPGETSPVILLATFADGSVLDVTGSSYVAYSSTNTSIATIDANGIATAASPGAASVTAVYTVATKSVSKAIPVTVATPALNPSLYSLLFSSQAVGTTSSPQTVTLTNLTDASLRIISLSTTGDFSETDNCLSASPLPSDGSCVATLTFKPTATGTRTGKLLIVNGSDEIPTAVALAGSGR